MQIKGVIRGFVNGIRISFSHDNSYHGVDDNSFVNFIYPYYHFLLSTDHTKVINGKTIIKQINYYPNNESKSIRIQLPLFDVVLVKYKKDFNNNLSPSDKVSISLDFKTMETEE